MSAEEHRLDEDRARRVNWKRWGPYLSERQWGTVREDYSGSGDAWGFFPFDHAHLKAYRWGEDGLGGICDRHQLVCLALALWNERDPILKERLFGLTGPEGNHGEDVKELYYYLDSTPTHSSMRFLYKYPQRAYPYRELREDAARRSRHDPELEIWDTGLFDDDRYFDVFVEYAKASADDIVGRVHVCNRGPDPAPLHVLPTIWFRNTWAWGIDARKPRLSAREGSTIAVRHAYYARRLLSFEGEPELLFTDNESNLAALYGGENASRYTKDGIGARVIGGRADAVNPERRGTKAAAHYRLLVPARGEAVIRFRFSEEPAAAQGAPAPPGSARSKIVLTGDGGVDDVIEVRRAEADAFYARLVPEHVSADTRSVMRQALAGMLWSKQFYGYDVKRWLRGDPGGPEPPAARRQGRNAEWAHLYNADVISMPDKWEYPWYAAWDLAFHCIPLAIVDPDFAKEQLVLLLREWFMHPNGQLPAYEWSFSDVNPPVHAWAAWRVYKIDRKRTGRADRRFLERVFHKLLLNFTWWVNRKDAQGRNVFQGGFLGLDNIGVFDRSAKLPTGGYLEQSDATSWMGMYCLNMLVIALELAHDNPVYEDVASKFFEHFVYICEAMNRIGGRDMGLWDRADGFFYDALRLPDGQQLPLKIRSMVGLIPLFAVETLDSESIDRLPRFKRRMQWFLENRPDLGNHVETQSVGEGHTRRLLALLNRDRLGNVLRYLLDEREFLSPHGIRALSRFHREHPYTLDVGGREYRVDYEPAESTTPLFGGNSNWRGPIWFPVNFLLVESLQKYHYFLGDGFKVEMPTGSGREVTLWQAATELSRRLVQIFLRDAGGRRPVFGGARKLQEDPHFRDHLLFYEYFHGDDGAGIGASHQTGWTGLVAKLIQQSGE